jgi:hypothetical protein
MPDIASVARHYTQGNLLDAIRAGVEHLGKSPDTVTVEDLAPVDEFHIGGRVATESLFENVGVTPDDHLLDVGCGLGGASRYVAKRYGCSYRLMTPERVFFWKMTLLRKRPQHSNLSQTKPRSLTRQRQCPL